MSPPSFHHYVFSSTMYQYIPSPLFTEQSVSHTQSSFASSTKKGDYLPWKMFFREVVNWDYFLRYDCEKSTIPYEQL
uniref:Uncharacterized protein n=1 Tax=Arundo donax TaxID=35708 RepID=A0A0A9BQP0_ARUDO